LLSDLFTESGELNDLIDISDTMIHKHSDRLEVPDVTIDRFFCMVGFRSDRGSEESLEIEGNDLPFVGDSTGEIVDIASCGQDFAGGSLILTHIVRDDGVAAS